MVSEEKEVVFPCGPHAAGRQHAAPQFGRDGEVSVRTCQSTAVDVCTAICAAQGAQWRTSKTPLFSGQSIGEPTELPEGRGGISTGRRPSQQQPRFEHRSCSRFLTADFVGPLEGFENIACRKRFAHVAHVKRRSIRTSGRGRNARNLFALQSTAVDGPTKLFDAIMIASDSNV